MNKSLPSINYLCPRKCLHSGRPFLEQRERQGLRISKYDANLSGAGSPVVVYRFSFVLLPTRNGNNKTGRYVDLTTTTKISVFVLWFLAGRPLFSLPIWRRVEPIDIYLRYFRRPIVFFAGCMHPPSTSCCSRANPGGYLQSGSCVGERKRHAEMEYICICVPTRVPFLSVVGCSVVLQ